MFSYRTSQLLYDWLESDGPSGSELREYRRLNAGFNRASKSRSSEYTRPLTFRRRPCAAWKLLANVPYSIFSKDCQRVFTGTLYDSLAAPTRGKYDMIWLLIHSYVQLEIFTQVVAHHRPQAFVL